MRRLIWLGPALWSLACGSTDDARDPIARDAIGAYEVDPESAAVFELVEVTRGVYMMPVQADRNPSQYAASVIVVRGDHVLVVDSRHGPASGRSLVASVREITRLPVRYLVNTHWHGDHVQGNQAFVDAYPEIEIIGGVTVDEDSRSIGRARLADEISRLDERLAGVRRDLEAGAREDGTPLAEDDLATLERQLELMEAYREDRGELELVEPTILVADTLVLDDARPVVHVIRVGPAHTRGDVIVHIPRRGVVAVGDLIEYGFPWFGDGYPSGWGEALDRVSELDARIFLPAHGPPLYDSELFETQRIFMKLLAEEAIAAVARGRGASSILENPAFSGFEDHFTQRLRQEGLGLQERQAAYDEFLEAAFARAYAEAAGELEEGG